HRIGTRGTLSSGRTRTLDGVGRAPGERGSAAARVPQRSSHRGRAAVCVGCAILARGTEYTAVPPLGPRGYQCVVPLQSLNPVAVRVPPDAGVADRGECCGPIRVDPCTSTFPTLWRPCAVAVSSRPRILCGREPILRDGAIHQLRPSCHAVPCAVRGSGARARDETTMHPD